MSPETVTPPRKTKRYSVLNVSRRSWFVRFCLRLVSWFFARVMARTKLEGLENIPTGACIFAANHTSIYDAILYFAFLPRHTQFVGPGDFRLRYPNRMAAEWTDVILVNRGGRDTASLRAMVETLNAGAPLGLFPEGGTWEKGLYNVKDGAAYLSMSCQVPLVPIAISGSYDLWNAIWTFKRPVISMRILPPLPVPPKARGNERKDLLEKTTIDLMHHIYQALEPSELERYKLYMRQQFTGTFSTQDNSILFPADANYPLVADLISKKNLFSTFHEHLRLPVKPFLHLDGYHSAAAFKAAVDALYEALAGELNGYMTYRRGEKARDAILLELAAISAILATTDAKTLLRFQVTIDELPLEISIEPPTHLPQDVV